MKTTILLFLAIGCAALMQETTYADSASPASQQTSSRTATKTNSDHPRDAQLAAPAEDAKNQKAGKPPGEMPDYRNASYRNHPRNDASLNKGNRPKQLPSSRNHSKPANAMNLHQPGPNKFNSAAKGGATHQEAVNSALPVRPSTEARSTAPSLENVRHRGANPAVIGGSANSYSGNTGAINGTRMNRKP